MKAQTEIYRISQEAYILELGYTLFDFVNSVFILSFTIILYFQ